MAAPALAFVPPAPPHALYVRQPLSAAALPHRPTLSSAAMLRPLAPPQRSLQQRPVQVLVFRREGERMAARAPEGECHGVKRGQRGAAVRAYVCVCVCVCARARASECVN
jgi:hypothetical protein